MDDLNSVESYGQTTKPVPSSRKPISNTAKTAIAVMFVVLAIAGLYVYAEYYYTTVTVPLSTSLVSITSNVLIGTGTTAPYNNNIGTCLVSGSTVICDQQPIPTGITTVYISMNVVNSAASPTLFKVYFTSTSAAMLVSLYSISGTSSSCTPSPPSSSSPDSCTLPYNTAVTLIYQISVTPPATATITLNIGPV